MMRRAWRWGVRGAIVIAVVGVVVFAGAFGWWHALGPGTYPAPAVVDVMAEYRELEAEVGTEDPAAWAELLAIAAALRDIERAVSIDIERELGLPAPRGGSHYGSVPAWGAPDVDRDALPAELGLDADPWEAIVLVAPLERAGERAAWGKPSGLLSVHGARLSAARYAASDLPGRLRAVLERPGVNPWPPADGPLLFRSDELDPLNRRLGDLGYFERERVAYAMFAGDDRAAVDALVALRLLALLAERNETIDLLIRSQFASGFARDRLLHVAPDLSDDGWLELAAQLRRIGLPSMDFSRTFRADRLFQIQIIDGFYLGDGRSGNAGWSQRTGWFARAAWKGVDGALSSHGKSRHYLDAVYEWTIQAATPPWPTAPGAESLPYELDLPRGLPFLLLSIWRDEPVEERGSWQFLPDFMMSRMIRVLGVHVMAAIDGYRAKHGVYPATLGELVPEFLAEVPIDPFHPDGAPLGYLPTYDHDAPPTERRPYLVYSVGWDGEDDGGRFGSLADTDAWHRTDLDIPLTVRR